MHVFRNGIVILGHAQLRQPKRTGPIPADGSDDLVDAHAGGRATSANVQVVGAKNTVESSRLVQYVPLPNLRQRRKPPDANRLGADGQNAISRISSVWANVRDAARRHVSLGEPLDHGRRLLTLKVDGESVGHGEDGRLEVMGDDHLTRTRHPVQVLDVLQDER